MGKIDWSKFNDEKSSFNVFREIKSKLLENEYYYQQFMNDVLIHILANVDQDGSIETDRIIHIMLKESDHWCEKLEPKEIG